MTVNFQSRVGDMIALGKRNMTVNFQSRVGDIIALGRTKT